jgi:DNA-binding response OmpR family regulator
MTASRQPTARILLVDDDDGLAALLAEYLGMHGFALQRESRGDTGAGAIQASQPDLVILDLMMPGANGLDVLRSIRGVYAGPVVMLTASQSEADHVAGLELGADDFVVKPIEPRVLLARIRAQLRRRRAGGPAERPGGPAEPALVSVVRVDGLAVDRGAREVSVDGAPVALTGMEFDVLSRLAMAAGTVVERDLLYREVMGVAYDGIDRGMDVHVSRIRRKLKDAGFEPTRLKAVRGVGYLLTCR